MPRNSRRAFLQQAAAGLGGLILAPPPAALATGRCKTLLAGAAKVKITPPLFVPYLTSSANGTNTPFTGVHDDLFARALALDDGRTSLAILAVDSIGYDNSILEPHRHFTAELRKRVAARTTLKPGSILLASTHAHSTPETIGLTPFRDVPDIPNWLEHHLRELVDSVVSAWQRREPVRAFHGVTTVTGIARNRRILLTDGRLSVHGPVPPAGQVALPWRLDEQLNVLGFERVGGGLAAVLMNYTAHPVVAMLLPQVCADYPGVATAMIEQHYTESTCLFTNGAAGNINSVKVSTHYDDVTALGQQLGRAALQQTRELLMSQPLSEINLAVRSTRIRLKPRDCPSLAEALKSASLDARTREGTQTRLAAKLAKEPLNGEIQVMRLGDVRWVSLPGEVFVETGLALKAAGANFIVGYGNGYLGYFPVHQAYQEGGYEVATGAWSRVAPGSAERLEAAARKLLRRV